MGFSRQEYWSGLPFPSPGVFPTQGLNPGLLHCRQTLYCLSHQEVLTRKAISKKSKPIWGKGTGVGCCKTKRTDKCLQYLDPERRIESSSACVLGWAGEGWLVGTGELWPLFKVFPLRLSQNKRVILTRASLGSFLSCFIVLINPLLRQLSYKTGPEHP